MKLTHPDLPGHETEASPESASVLKKSGWVEKGEETPAAAVTRPGPFDHEESE